MTSSPAVRLCPFPLLNDTSLQFYREQSISSYTFKSPGDGHQVKMSNGIEVVSQDLEAFGVKDTDE